MDSWQRPDINIGIIQPVNGEVQVLSLWVKPVEFSTVAGEVVSPSPQAKQVVAAAQRVEGYIKYRWPLWNFHVIVFKYTTPNAPQHYRVNLRNSELTQISGEDLECTKMLLDQHSVITFIPCSIRFLYP